MKNGTLPGLEPITLWVDRDTGLETKLKTKFIRGALRFIDFGSARAITASRFLELMGEKETDSNRRQLRGAFDYLIYERGLPICALSSIQGGYFIAQWTDEVAAALEDKRKKIASLQKTVQHMERMSLQDSRESLQSAREFFLQKEIGQ